MTAEIVSVGTELLMGQIADTNAQALGQLLPSLGISHRWRQTVGDNLDRVTEALKVALGRSDIVFTIGGLGPTEDDLTRQGIAAALGEELVFDPSIAADLKDLFKERGIPWTDSQERQAYRPSCSRPLSNPNGTAPGLVCEKEGKVVIALPGPKGEFGPMLSGPVTEYLAGLERGEVIHSRLLRVCGMGESLVEEKIRPLLDSSNPTVAPYAHLGEVHLRISAKASNIDLADAMIAPVEERIRSVLGDSVYAAGDTTLEAAVLDLLKARELTVAVAESISGGGLGARFTSVAGSGDAFLGGVISYQKDVKASVLGVDRAVLDDPDQGPVSEECARQMALGVLRVVNADCGVSLTGNAGPTTDDGDKPVGLVYIGVAGPGTQVVVQEYKFRGVRADIQRRSTQAALTLLRNVLLRSSDGNR